MAEPNLPVIRITPIHKLSSLPNILYIQYVAHYLIQYGQDKGMAEPNLPIISITFIHKLSSLPNILYMCGLLPNPIWPG